MSLIEWNKALELGLARMDETHREFADLCNALGEARDEGLLTALDALITHSAAHFAQENRWMERSGFPPIHVHMGEHERVLRLLREAREEVAAGDLPSGRRLAEGLPAWFRDHAASMDAALAYHIKASGFDVEESSDPAAA